MRFLLSYLRQRRAPLLLAALSCILFAVTFLLYHLPVGAVLYPAVLCAAMALVWLAVDVRRASRKHKTLRALQSLPEDLPEELSCYRTQDDADYRELIRLLREERRALQTRMNARYSDMTEYYTVWAHQIKTPIASMRLTLQNEDTDISRQLSTELFRIEQYVEMVLCYVRLDSESTDYVLRSYEIDAIVREVLRKFAGQFIRRNLTLHYTPLEGTVITDEKWLSFVIGQVLSNALKYTPSGSITIDMEAQMTLCIRDTGIGIAPEDLPRVFEKGYTGYNGRGDKKASGLGLYLCRRICGNLNHSIEAASEPGVGTVIRLHLEQAARQTE